MRPWILLDVDDVLNWCPPKGHDPPYCGCQEHQQWRRRTVTTRFGRPLRVRVNPALGPMLLRLAEDADLAWCTAWAEDANLCIGPLLGLPPLPVTDYQPWPGDPVHHPGFGAWKALNTIGWLARAGGGRPFVWFDDEPDIAPCLTAAGVSQPFKVIAVDPETALTAVHVGMARAWLSELDRV